MIDALAKAKELVQDAYYDERGLSDVMRWDAQIYAAIAQAEQLKRVADYLENISGAYTAATFGYYPEGVGSPPVNS